MFNDRTSSSLEVVAGLSLEVACRYALLMVELRTDRLLLRSAVAEDLPAVHRILSNARSTAYWSTPPHQTLDQTREWLQNMIAIDPAEGEDFIVEHRGTVIGKAGLYRFPEVGFIFHPDAWGRGFAREALAPVVERAFAVHGLPSIEADVDPRNSRCLRLLQRFGFAELRRQRRTWLVGDQWCDSVYLRLDLAAWTAGGRSHP